MKLKSSLYFLLPLLLLLTACDLEKAIDVELPPHEAQLVVECYLEPGKPMRATVLESVSYFDEPQPPLVPDAEVFITYNGKTTRLNYAPFIDKEINKFYTHRSDELVEGKPGEMYSLEVKDGKGRRVTGFTTMLPRVPIDTLEYRFNEKEEALLLTSYQDDPNSRNFYRYMTHIDSLHEGSDREFTVSDELTNGTRVTLGSAYDYDKGDSLTVTLYHIEEQYYNFLRSTSDAKNANGNPFAQPSKIASTVQGGIGVFTNLAYDRQTVIIK
ncbi:DUF4249 domain-containing protein [Pontibacter ruber]|uniref:DUF4249 domain-containing protein n=1 Tax=Pontibacter ruber TaxID=1343895 RepID=A0ABW5CZ89_9BACT|nr:DUF4249 domain-containing protein [Pontibacter ruber]